MIQILANGIEVPDLNHIPFQEYGIAEWLWLGTILGMIALAYLLPTVIAIVNKHPAALGIGVLNLTLGWTQNCSAWSLLTKIRVKFLKQTLVLLDWM